VEIECLPAEIPTEFRLDVTNLMIGMALRARDIQFDATKMKLVTETERVIAHVVPLRVEEEKPADAVAAEAATPRTGIIKKGKREVEGEEGPKPRSREEEVIVLRESGFQGLYLQTLR